MRSPKGTEAQMANVEQPPKMPPMLRVDLEEIEGAGDLELGDTLALLVRGQVTSLSQFEPPPGGAKLTHVELTISSIKLEEKDLRPHADEVPTP